MKKFLLFTFAIIVNCFIGGLGAATFGVAPAIGAVALNVAGMAFPSMIPAGSFGAGIYAEVWTGFMTKAFRTAAESVGWYAKIKSYDQYAENEVIHFVNIGGDPTVLINNTTYPLGIETLADADKPISLDKYQTKATAITDDELQSITYDKIGSVIERHRESIDEKKYAKAIHSIAPAGNTTATPVLLTSGATDETGTRKVITRADIIALKKKFDDAKNPVAGRMLVLCNDHVNDLLNTDQKFADQYHNYTTGKISNLYGFEVYEYTESPYYTVSTLAKIAFGAVATANERQASVAFYAPRMMKANGTTKTYMSEAKQDTQNQQNLVNFRHYSICLPLKNEAIGAIVSSKPAVPAVESVTVAPTAMTFDAAGEAIVAAVTASSAFTVEITGTGFTKATVGNAITVTAAANTGAQRTGSVTITVTADPTKTATIALTQTSGN
jgi:hypothetical protein